MSRAIIANGTKLQMGSGGVSITTFVTIPEVMKISGPSVKFALLDVTSHDTIGNFREYIPGLADGDTISAELNWRPSNYIHQALRADSYARDLCLFQVIFPASSGDSEDAGSDENTCSVSGYIAGLTPKADIGAVLTAALEIKVTGAPTWS